MKLFNTVALALTVLVTSCVSAPDRMELTLPDAVPDTWTTTPLPSTSEVGDEWWRSFGSEELNLLVAEALVQNPSLAAAAARIDSARALATIAGADLLPRLSAGASVQRQRSQFFAPGFGPQTNRVTLHTLQLSTSWEIDLWGRIRAGEQAALADLQSSEAAFEGALLSLVAQVTRAYFQLTDARLQLELAQSNRDRVKDLSDRIEERYSRGLRSALDLRLSKAEAAADDADVATRRAILDAAQRRLEILLGRYPSGALRTSGPLPSELPSPPMGIPSTLLERRPDVVEAERRVAAQERRFQQARRAMLPSFSLSASGGTAAEKLSDILDKDFGIWNVLGNVFAPLFEGGRLRADVQRNKAGLVEAMALFAHTALFAFSEVETALRADVDLRERELALQRAAEESRLALEISEQRYFTGVIDILDTLEAQRRLLNAQSARLSAQLARAENRIDLFAALGGGYRGLAPGTGDSHVD